MAGLRAAPAEPQWKLTLPEWVTPLECEVITAAYAFMRAENYLHAARLIAELGLDTELRTALRLYQWWWRVATSGESSEKVH